METRQWGKKLKWTDGFVAKCEKWQRMKKMKMKTKTQGSNGNRKTFTKLPWSTARGEGPYYAVHFTIFSIIIIILSVTVQSSLIAIYASCSVTMHDFFYSIPDIPTYTQTYKTKQNQEKSFCILVDLVFVLNVEFVKVEQQWWCALAFDPSIDLFGPFRSCATASRLNVVFDNCVTGS